LILAVLTQILQPPLLVLAHRLFDKKAVPVQLAPPETAPA
jgi:hypothetical protein